jgi:AcrB/AcrD/AcrF family
VNIFTRIGFVVLVGLASKNAILIVEFAKVQRGEGLSRRQATLEACKLRLRPIVMTSLAFILGVLPLCVSRGAGAEMRNTLGTAVFSGMIGVTLFGVLLTPVFFYSIDWLSHSRVFMSQPMQMLSYITISAISLKPLRDTLKPVREAVGRSAVWQSGVWRRLKREVAKQPVLTVKPDALKTSPAKPAADPTSQTKPGSGEPQPADTTAESGPPGQSDSLETEMETA